MRTTLTALLLTLGVYELVTLQEEKKEWREAR